MKTITMTLDPSSIRNAISEIRQYRNELQTKCNRACRKLGQFGVISVLFNYSAIADVDDDFTVLPVQGKEGMYRVVARGEDVAFVEFGTGEGVAYPSGYPKDGFASQVYAGSWSQQFNGMFAQKGYWYYKRRKLYGERAGMPMYIASQNMRDNIAAIFKEEFRDRR